MELTQKEIIAFLASREAYGPECSRVDRIETHISVVFLAGDRAFKLKRAVHFPYVDYSTLDARRLFCEKELRLNRRTAPTLYRRVVPVTRSATGSLQISGVGTPLEWLVEMRRFEQDRRLDIVAARGGVDVRLAAAIGAAAARLHATAEPRRDRGGASAMQWVVDENDAELSAAGDAIPQSLRAQIDQASLDALTRHGSLLDARRDRGWVRECHGDLHLGNIFLEDDAPVLFDGIEFNDGLSCIDVLYDVAFLMMDLLHRDLPQQANAALNAWLERLPQYDALALLPLFLSCRAAIRAKVLITTIGVSSDADEVRRLGQDASAYLALANRVFAPATGGIVGIGGLSGSGKSTLARLLAPGIGRSPGAVVLRSDVVRKRRFGVEPAVRLPDVAYEPPVSAAVYRDLTESARQIARAGYIAVVDAVFPTEALRRALREAAVQDDVRFLGLWLDAPVDVMERRLAGRPADASDATAAVLRGQRTTVELPVDWQRLDASGSVDHAVQTAQSRIAEQFRRPSASSEAASSRR